MTARKLPASRGAAWIVDGVARIRRDPVPFLRLCLGLGLLMALPVVGFLAGLLSVFFYAGLVHSLHAQSQGRAPVWADAFAGLTTPGAAPRLALILALNLALALLALFALSLALGPAIAELLRAGGEPTPEQLLALLPQLSRTLLLLLPLAIVVGWVTFLAIPRAMLDDVTGGRALADALAALVTNLGALLVNLLCLVLVIALLVALMVVPLLLVEAVARVNGALGLLLRIPVSALMSGAVLALYSSMMYQAWRELFASADADADTAPPTPDRIEV